MEKLNGKIYTLYIILRILLSIEKGDIAICKTKNKTKQKVHMNELGGQ